MLAEDLNVALPLTVLGPRGVRAGRSAASSRGRREAGVDPGRRRTTYLPPLNTEYELFTAGQAAHAGGGVRHQPQDSLDLATPPVGPVAQAGP